MFPIWYFSNTFFKTQKYILLRREQTLGVRVFTNFFLMNISNPCSECPNRHSPKGLIGIHLTSYSRDSNFLLSLSPADLISLVMKSGICWLIKYLRHVYGEKPQSVFCFGELTDCELTCQVRQEECVR